MGKRAKSAKDAKHTNTTHPVLAHLAHFTGPDIGREAMLTFQGLYRGFVKRAEEPWNNFKKRTNTFNGGNSFLVSCIQFCGGTYCGGMNWRQKGKTNKTNKISYCP